MSDPAWLTQGAPHVWRPYCQMKTARPPLPVVATRGSRLVLADGREGYRVRGTLGGAPFRGVMVADADAWWIVLTEEDLGEAGIAIGDSVTVTAEPDS